MSESPKSAAEVHEFWFAGCARDPERAASRNFFWFNPSADTDEQIEKQFAATVASAESGELDGWQQQPISCLSLILLLDQMPRSLRRGRAEAFRNDATALVIARAAIGRGCLARLSVVERAFLLMPFQHVEDRAGQEEGVGHYSELVEDASPEWREVAEGYRAHAIQHREIIERFGRFPHRNPILGRSSTAAEAAYLASGGQTFGQAV